MRAICNLSILLVLVFTPMGLLSQEELKLPQVRTGFRIVNATGLPENVFFEVDGRMLNPKGFATGKRTGLMGLGVGNYQIKADHPTKGIISFNLSLSEGNQTSLLLFLETHAPKEKEKTPLDRKISFYSLPSRAPGYSEASLTIIQLTDAPSLNIKIGASVVEAERLKPLIVTRQQNIVQEPTILIKDKPLCSYNLEDNQDYLLVIYTNAKGDLDFIKFSNPP